MNALKRLFLLLIPLLTAIPQIHAETGGISTIGTGATNINDVLSGSTASGVVIDVKMDYDTKLLEITREFLNENNQFNKIGYENTYFINKSLGDNYNGSVQMEKAKSILTKSRIDNAMNNYINENAWFFQNVLPGIKGKGYKMSSMNPFNGKGIFLIPKMETYVKKQNCTDASGKQDGNLYNQCSVVLDLYRDGRTLTEKEQALQYLDMVGYVVEKFGRFDEYYASDTQYAPKQQLKIIFDSLKMNYSKDDIANILSLYDFRNDTFVTNKQAETLYYRNEWFFKNLMINEPNEMKNLIKTIWYDSLGIAFSGNQPGFVEKKGEFVSDSGFVSNNPDTKALFYIPGMDSAKTLDSGYGSTFKIFLDTNDEKSYAVKTNLLIFMKRFMKNAKML